MVHMGRRRTRGTHGPLRGAQTPAVRWPVASSRGSRPAWARPLSRAPRSLGQSTSLPPASLLSCTCVSRPRVVRRASAEPPTGPPAGAAGAAAPAPAAAAARPLSVSSWVRCVTACAGSTRPIMQSSTSSSACAWDRATVRQAFVSERRPGSADREGMRQRMPHHSLPCRYLAVGHAQAACPGMTHIQVAATHMQSPPPPVGCCCCT